MSDLQSRATVAFLHVSGNRYTGRVVDKNPFIFGVRPSLIDQF